MTTAISANFGMLAGFRVLLGLLVVVGVLGSQSGGGTLAVFTSSASSTNNTFSVGTVTISLADANESAATSIQASIGGTNLKANQTLLAGFVDVSNTGSLDFTYTSSTSRTSASNAANDALNAGLTVVVESRASGTCNAAAGASGQTAVTASTALSGWAIATPRALAASGSERLCFYVSVGDLANAAQGGTDTYTLTFTATQS